MSEPTRRDPKMVDGVLFPVRYVREQQCFEQADFKLVSCERVGQIATKLAGMHRPSTQVQRGK